MDNVTASEIAGFGVGTLLLFATIAAPRVDAFISASQRSSLAMCKKCGNLRMIACSRCKGTGSVASDGAFSFMNDLYQYFGSEDKISKMKGCSTCQARGHFSCPECSRSP